WPTTMGTSSWIPLVDRIQHLEPSLHGGDDFHWALGPVEWPWVAVVFGEEAIDGGLQFDDGSEHAALETSLGQGGEEALDSVEPRSRGGCEVERPARVPGQLSADLGMLVGGVVVGDGMDQLAGRHGGLDGAEEADELLMAVLLHAPADHAAIQHVES